MLTVILTGGQSRRMGRDKALLPVGNETMSLKLAKCYACLGPVAFSVDRSGRFDCGGYLELPDTYPRKGPLNGLYSAFTQTDENAAFFTATDMPNGDPELARTLSYGLGEYDASIIRRADGRLEPMFGVFRRRCLPQVKAALESENRSFRAVFERMNVHYFSEDDLKEWDLNVILANLNTPEAYESFLAQEALGDPAKEKS